MRCAALSLPIRHGSGRSRILASNTRIPRPTSASCNRPAAEEHVSHSAADSTCSADGRSGSVVLADDLLRVLRDPLDQPSADGAQLGELAEIGGDVLGDLYGG